MLYKKRTSLLSIKMISTISKYVNHHSSWCSSFIFGNNENGFMNGNQQDIIPSELMSLWHFVKIEKCDAILVEDRQILLINGVELYNRKRTLDPHHERFGPKFMIGSLPTLFNKYEYELNILYKIEDRSRKIIIGTNVFNALVISSKRLGIDSTSEAGPSTYSFTPSSQTSQCNDFGAQLGRIRSSLVDPYTYLFARFFSKWTDILIHRLYTIFTIKDKSNLNEYRYIKVALQVLAEIAKCMIFNKGALQKSRLDAIGTGDLDTSTAREIHSLYKVYTHDDNLTLVANSNVEEIAMELVTLITNNLKAQNESVILALDDLMNLYADNSSVSV